MGLADLFSFTGGKYIYFRGPLVRDGDIYFELELNGGEERIRPFNGAVNLAEDNFAARLLLLFNHLASCSTHPNIGRQIFFFTPWAGKWHECRQRAERLPHFSAFLPQTLAGLCNMGVTWAGVASLFSGRAAQGPFGFAATVAGREGACLDVGCSRSVLGGGQPSMGGVGHCFSARFFWACIARHIAKWALILIGSFVIMVHTFFCRAWHSSYRSQRRGLGPQGAKRAGPGTWGARL